MVGGGRGAQGATLCFSASLIFLLMDLLLPLAFSLSLSLFLSLAFLSSPALRRPPLARRRFSGGSYGNHGRFACWASGQFVIGGLCGLVHALLPPLLPFVAEEVGLELGGLIVNRRKLRNKQEGFVNPADLSEFLTTKWDRKFAAAAREAAANADVGVADRADGGGSGGGTELAAAKIRVKLGPNEAGKFL